MNFPKKTNLLLVSVLTIFSGSVYPQESYFTGARSAALGHTSSSLSDEFSLINNPGTLGFVEKGSISVGYMDLYGIEGLSSVYAVLSKAIKSGCLSLGATSLGDNIFRQDKLTFGIGNKFGIASIGAGINYHHMTIEGFGSNTYFSLDVGGLVELSPSVFISGLVKNITQAKVSKYTGEYLPTLMSAGISFRPAKQLLINTQYDKEVDYHGILKFGIEFTYSSLVVRTGLITDPARIDFGLGFHYKKLKIDYALKNHQILQSSHVVNLAFLFK